MARTHVYPTVGQLWTFHPTSQWSDDRDPRHYVIEHIHDSTMGAGPGPAAIVRLRNLATGGLAHPTVDWLTRPEDKRRQLGYWTFDGEGAA